VAGMAGRIPRSERLARSERTPIGIHIGLGAVAVLAAVIVSALLPSGGWRLVPVAVVLVVLGVSTVDLIAVAAVAVLGYLLIVGFLVNQFGVLSWHGMSDTYRLAVVVAAAGSGVAIGAVRHRSRQSRRFVLPRQWSAAEPAFVRGLTQLSNKEDVAGV
jgi:hypothetical protein